MRTYHPYTMKYLIPLNQYIGFITGLYDLGKKRYDTKIKLKASTKINFDS